MNCVCVSCALCRVGPELKPHTVWGSTNAINDIHFSWHISKRSQEFNSLIQTPNVSLCHEVSTWRWLITPPSIVFKYPHDAMMYPWYIYILYISLILLISISHLKHLSPFFPNIRKNRCISAISLAHTYPIAIPMIHNYPMIFPMFSQPFIPMR